MRNALLLSLLLATAASTTARGEGAPQAQPAPAPKPAAPPATTQKPAQHAAGTTAKPATPAPARVPAGQRPPRLRRRCAARTAPANARGGNGDYGDRRHRRDDPGVRIAAEGPTQRGGETNGSGQANFPGLQGGVYRLRFDGDAVVSFEKEVTVRGGQVLAVDVMLNPAKKAAPPPPAPVAAPPPPRCQDRSRGQPLQVNIVAQLCPKGDSWARTRGASRSRAAAANTRRARCCR